MGEQNIISILENLLTQQESEWLEFKENNSNKDTIGEYISALSNSAALNEKQRGYVIWGIEDKTQEVVGTTFNPTSLKVGNQDLTLWVLQRLSPKTNFHFHEFVYEGNDVVLLEIEAAFEKPTSYKHVEYVRVGQTKTFLRNHPEKERKLWRLFDRKPFEKQAALENVTIEKVLELLDYPSYFELLKLPLPEGREGILSALADDEMIKKDDAGGYSITNLGAILFAKKLDVFPGLKRKAVRVVSYPDDTRLRTTKENRGNKGYAVGFPSLIEYLLNILPSNEVIKDAFRAEVPMYPELAVRELVANALIHQDFHLTGTGPLIEIFPTRLEITNPGVPVVNTDRFIDTPPKSRNEALASFMRRANMCEERGSGIDKVVVETEVYQLPAPIFETTDEHTRIVLFAHKEFNDMDKADKVRACYLHASLRYVQRDFMTNASLRDRFGIDEKNSAVVSRIIRDALDEGDIKIHDVSVGTRARKYVPYWQSNNLNN